ncbi:hypothetical protein Sste5346_003952 [Sporothrix stenoceras]|uniref:Uncharacterized protein n=1 Tax=Sporothrix stenoceras TaxID=5173 RepID=A0ABR3ZBE7_9PEZI
MGRPEFPGLFIGDDKNDDAKRKDSNKGAPLEHVQIDIGMWSFLYQSWNTTNLRRLHIQWTSDAGHALAALAFRGELASVETLWLAGIHKSSDGTCSDIHDIIGHIPALHDLRLTGNVTNAIFDTILHHHNATIRSLYLQPYEEDEFEEGHVDDDSGQLFAWSPTMIQQLTENCLLLEAVFVEVARTRGDRNEVALYRALGTMPHLKHLLLHLICPLDMGPGSEELDGNPTKITADAHKTTFTNAAVDKTLARSIFNVISREGQGCLQTLHLIPEFHARYHTGYTAAVRALTLPWACTRQANGEVVVEAIHKRETKDTIEECAGMIEGNKLCLKGQEEIYPYVFMELWPGNEPWWEGWTSLPLDLS